MTAAASSSCSVSSPVDSRVPSIPVSLNDLTTVTSRVQTAASNVQDAPRSLSSSSLPSAQSALMPPASHSSSMIPDRSQAVVDRRDQPAFQVSERVAVAAVGRGIAPSGPKDGRSEITARAMERDNDDFVSPSRTQRYFSCDLNKSPLRAWLDGYSSDDDRWVGSVQQKPLDVGGSDDERDLS